MENVILIIVLAVILGGVVGYIWKSRRSGVKCIGCPHAKNCGGNCGSCSHR